MTDQTPLDTAHAAMESAPEDDTVRLRFYERLADAELFLLLSAEAQGDNVTPRLFPVEAHTFVLAFDREERLTSFTGGPAPYAALSGRALATLLTEQSLGLGLNLEVAPSAMLLPPDAVSWLAATVAHDHEPEEALPQEISAPVGLPEVLITALDTKLAMAAGLAHCAYLVGVRYADGRRGHLLAFVDPVPGAEEGLAQAAREALVFSGIEAGEMDVTFLKASDPSAARSARHGLRFDLPQFPDGAVQTPGANPGMDPARPPKLR
ncbi:SseB family protein [Tropicimonas sp. S265A]|uniref:SseB family protein n=1 Tax=Tropicimonas sp. S265A TaxID=3415134 RepID=UPI003C7A6205